LRLIVVGENVLVRDCSSIPAAYGVAGWLKDPLHSTRTYVMAVFTGTLKLRIIEASDLKPTDFAMRLPGSRKTTIDPYVSVGIDSDPPHCLRTKSQSKTCSPQWNEDFSVEVQNGTALTLAIFDDRAIPPDEFVADCSLSFEEYTQAQTTGWVSVIPQFFPSSFVPDFSKIIFQPQLKFDFEFFIKIFRTATEVLSYLILPYWLIN
jgi:hypothetical protein